MKKPKLAATAVWLMCKDGVPIGRPYATALEAVDAFAWTNDKPEPERYEAVRYARDLRTAVVVNAGHDR